MFSGKTGLAVTALATLLMVAAPAVAQDAAPSQTQETQANMDEAPSHTFSESVIDAYAETAMKIAMIHQEMAPQIQTAGSTEAQKELFTTMQERMITTVDNSEGITLEEYREISEAAREDRDLAMEITEKLRAMQPEQPSGQ